MAKRSRIYWRDQGGEKRAYGDFRDLGGKREALIPPGETRATPDPVVAEMLSADRIRELEGQRRFRNALGTSRTMTLEDLIARHLEERAREVVNERLTEAWLVQAEQQLRDAAEFLGAGTDVARVTPSDVERWKNHLSEQPNGRGKTLSNGTVRSYLNSLSNLFRRARSLECVPPGFNPVADLIDKPTGRRQEAKWLEVHEAALLLESARTYTPKRDDITLPIYPIVATFLLTGGRQAEVLGLALDDVSFDRKTVTFRPNQFRRLKTSTSHRVVPLWPQLEAILRPYVFEGDEPPGQLLFPSPKLSGEGMITDTRKALDAIGKRVGWNAGEIRTKMFRHTYCATRLQTVDRGAPVSEYTVAKEMGHGGTSLVRRVYGHLGQVRHRSEVMEYRVEQHQEALKDGLTLMRRAIAAETKREAEKDAKREARRLKNSAGVSANAGRFEPTPADAEAPVPL
jgi:integrase